MRQAIDDIEARRNRLVRKLELLEDGDGDLMRDICQRSVALSAERNGKLDELAAHERERPVRSCPDLLDLIPLGEVDLTRAPEPVLRRLFEAFRLEISYDKRSGIADCKVTLTGAAIDQQGRIAADVMAEARAGGGGAAPVSRLFGAPGRIRTCDTRFRSVLRIIGGSVAP
ncbi:hypothetical protein J4709_43470 [Actinomadura sp. LCR2-06]|uniref:Uncharacterized protein n=1 Tax=Actinomadura violacea TaxID=2819934 RepID=A0ABS3S793_9ACTN|nr:hypothetical protein [Actinomadura violacea]